MRYTTVYKFSAAGNLNIRVFDHERTAAFATKSLRDLLYKGFNTNSLKQYKHSEAFLHSFSTCIEDCRTSPNIVSYFCKPSRHLPTIDEITKLLPEMFI